MIADGYECSVNLFSYVPIGSKKLVCCLLCVINRWNNPKEIMYSWGGNRLIKMDLCLLGRSVYDRGGSNLRLWE